MTCTFGIDIVKKSRGKDKFALFIIYNEQEIEKIVSKAKLFRLVRQYKPSLISIDNISELFSSKDELIRFLKCIPSGTKLVQIAGKQSLHYLSKRYGLKIDIKNPIDEAKASAYLASFGVGEEVSVFVDKTKITVSRNRSVGKGGWRQNRYRRKIHDAVRTIYREIKELLDDIGMDYSEEVHPGYGGLSKGVLLVNAPKSDIPVNSFKTRDVQVKVEAVEKDRIEFIPLSKTTIHVIAGIDPGTTTAVAILDLNGNLLGVRSKKNWKTGEVIEYILSFGQPVIIATDKCNPPEYVSKLRASFNAVLHTPKEDMSIERKKALVSDYKFLNDHERDATASAIDAYNSFKNKFLNVEKRVPPGVDVDAIKTCIIKGVSLKEALSEKKVEEQRRKKTIQQITRKELVKKDKIIRELEMENSILRKEISELKNEIEKLRSKLVSISREEHEKIRKETYVKNLESEIFDLKSALKERDEQIRELEERIRLLKKMKMLEFTGWKSIKLLKKFARDEIERMEKEVGLSEGDVIYIADPSGAGKSGAEYLCSKNIRAVIAERGMSHLAQSIFDEEGVPVIEPGEIEIEISDDIAVINSKKFEEVYRRKVREIERKKVESIEKLVLDYKKGRSANVR